MKTIIALIVLTVASFANLSYAQGLQYPERVTYEKTKVGFWCQRDDIRAGDCKIISLSPDEQWVSVTGTAGAACADTPVGVVNIVTGKAIDVDYDGECRTNARPRFIRLNNGHLGLQVVDTDADWAIKTIALN